MIIVYHHNDADGKSAAAMVAMAYPLEEKKFIETSYPINVNVNEYKHSTNISKIFFVDLSFKSDDLPMITELSNTGIPIVWIDHHESSNNLIKSGAEIPESIDKTVDISRCGAYLTYEYLHKYSDVPAFIKLIDIWDRHVTTSDMWSSARCLKVSLDAISDTSPMAPIWTEFVIGGKPVLQYYIDRGGIISEYLDNYNKQLLKKNGVVTKIMGIECISINYVGDSSVLDSVRAKFPLSMIWNYDGHTYKYSIFTDSKTINCEKIAELFGGGGHRGASGFKSEQLLFFPEFAEPYSERRY